MTPPGQPPARPEMLDLAPAALVNQPLCLAELERALDLALGRAPVLAPGAGPTAQAEPPARAGLGPGPRVLLAEDYPTNRLLAQRHLETIGCRVIMAEDGRQAVEALGAQEFDLVLMDVQMPEMDGYAATRAIRALEAERRAEPVPIVALTAHATKEHRQQCFAAGMDDYLPKPFRRQDLLAMVAKWTGQDQLTSLGQSPMDLEEALAEFDNDAAFLAEVLDGFWEQTEERLKGMRLALALGDAGQLAALAHAVKGGAANLTGRPAAEAAARLEEMAQAGRVEQAARGLQVLESELRRMQAYAREHLKGASP